MFNTHTKACKDVPKDWVIGDELYISDGYSATLVAYEGSLIYIRYGNTLKEVLKVLDLTQYSLDPKDYCKYAVQCQKETDYIIKHNKRLPKRLSNLILHSHIKYTLNTIKHQLKTY